MSHVISPDTVEQGTIVTLYTGLAEDAKPKEIKTVCEASRSLFKELLEAGTGQKIGRHTDGEDATVILYDQRDREWANTKRETLPIIIGISELTDYDTDTRLAWERALEMQEAA